MFKIVPTARKLVIKVRLDVSFYVIYIPDITFNTKSIVYSMCSVGLRWLPAPIKFVNHKFGFDPNEYHAFHIAGKCYNIHLVETRGIIL